MRLFEKIHRVYSLLRGRRRVLFKRSDLDGMERLWRTRERADQSEDPPEHIRYMASILKSDLHHLADTILDDGAFLQLLLTIPNSHFLRVAWDYEGDAEDLWRHTQQAPGFEGADPEVSELSENRA